MSEKILRKPSWLKRGLGVGGNYGETSGMLHGEGLHTICESGRCPNWGECWSRRVATFMIGGDVCTRSCRFCGTKSGRPTALDINEPIKVARAAKAMGLRHVVVTSVDRDDLVDGGVEHWVQTIQAIRSECPGATLEVLVPDFEGDEALLTKICEADPDIVGHNIETVRRLTPSVRSVATYERSMEVLKFFSDHGMTVKSGLMVGLGETETEVTETLRDLHEVGVRRVTIGQYMQPSKAQIDVSDYIEPQKFDHYQKIAKEIGFTHAFCGPFVRSSYMADM